MGVAGLLVGRGLGVLGFGEEGAFPPKFLLLLILLIDIWSSCSRTFTFVVSLISRSKTRPCLESLSFSAALSLVGHADLT